MLFNSLVFALFLPVAFGGYWLLGRWFRLQNLFVVAVSYLFYGWWDWRFVPLLALTSAVAWGTGLLIERDGGGKRWVWLSALINLGLLGTFKYYDFFVSSVVAALGAIGIEAHAPTLRLLLPVGISFYTFQAMSYTFDVARGTVRAVREPVAFFAYVSFFPQLVAGPIERATHLLPQFLAPRHFDYTEAVDGCRLMLWGFFKKMVVADGCAELSRKLLSAGADANWLGAWMGVFCFTIQIYGDFSGYSDIAIGCARLFGVHLRRNFACPYFSRDIAEFWRRWHISLNTWFRDYLYIPLGGSRCGKWKQLRNTFVIFLVSGLWHGANWTFVLWGGIHACCFLPLLLLGRNRRWLDQPTVCDAPRMLGTFLIAMLAWAVFLAPDIGTAWAWFRTMASLPTTLPLHGQGLSVFVRVLPWTLLLFAVEWVNRAQPHALARLPRQRWVRWLIYIALAATIVVFQAPEAEFIYFQF